MGRLRTAPEQIERMTNAVLAEQIRDALTQEDGNRTRAAAKLGIPRSTFYRWLRRLQLMAWVPEHPAMAPEPGVQPVASDQLPAEAPVPGGHDKRVWGVPPVTH